MTIEEHYWNRFCRLNKAGKASHAYVLGGSALLDNVELIFFYSILPFQEINGYADFIEKIIDNSDRLWNALGQETCFKSYDEYMKLTREKEKATFIRFNNLHEAINPVAFAQLSTLLEIRRMPQIGMYVNKTQTNRLIEMLSQLE